MTDAIWLLSNRALFNYAKAATLLLLTRMYRDEFAKHSPTSTNVTEEFMNETANKSDKRATPVKLGYGMLGFIYAVAAYQIPSLIVAYVISSTIVAELIVPSALIQFAVGFLLSVIAYTTVSNRSLKSGMRTCYGLIIGSLFVLGGYTILASLTSF